jgi:hypothetical protein
MQKIEITIILEAENFTGQKLFDMIESSARTLTDGAKEYSKTIANKDKDLKGNGTMYIKVSEEKRAEPGNVIENKNGHKFVVDSNRKLEPGEKIVAQKPHDDGDYSYLCNQEYCRCYQ